ncbi:hypothetical protein BDV19DRAFT_380437 [Aspergillus venezuelensis]
MALEDELHIKTTTCLLCRQPPNVGARIIVTADDLRRFHDATKPVHQDKYVVRAEREPCREGLFSEHSRNILDGIFSQDLLRKLPLEVLDFILERLKPSVRKLLLEASTTPLESTSTTEVHHMKLPANIKQIALSMDSTAVRGIQFLGGDSRPTSDGWPWYKFLNPKDSVNGRLFMRDIELNSCSSSIEDAMWSSHFQPKFQRWNLLGHRKTHRLQYLPLDCKIRGLMVCCVSTKIIRIHRCTDTPGTLEKELWIYFPLNAREHVLGAWIRHRKGRAPGPFFALILHTSLGRTVTFGGQSPSYVRDELHYHPLLLEGEAPITGMFHDGLDPRMPSDTISEVGVACAEERESADSGPPPLPADVHSEPLEDFSKMQLCRDIRQSHCPAMGALIFYEDGHVEALGQMRWDFDVAEYVYPPFYIRKRVVDGRDYILDIKNNKSNVILMTRWEALPQAGTIVWWFSRLGDKVITYKD